MDRSDNRTLKHNLSLTHFYSKKRIGKVLSIPNLGYASLYVSEASLLILAAVLITRVQVGKTPVTGSELAASEEASIAYSSLSVDSRAVPTKLLPRNLPLQ